MSLPSLQHKAFYDSLKDPRLQIDSWDFFLACLFHCDSRATNQLILAKISDSSQLPFCHWALQTNSSSAPSHFPYSWVKLPKAQNKRTGRLLHLAQAVKENKSQPLFRQLRRGNTFSSLSSNASPASTHLLIIHHWVKTVPSSRDKLSNSPPSQLCISLRISLVISWGSGRGCWPQKILCKPTCTMAVMYCWKCSFVLGRKSRPLKALTPDLPANNAAPSARNVPVPEQGGETDRERAVTQWESWGNQQGNRELEREGVWTKDKGWAKCLQSHQNQAAPEDSSQDLIQTGKASFQCVLILLFFFFVIFRWGCLIELNADSYLWLLLNIAFTYLV